MDAEYCRWGAGKINYNFSLLYTKKQSMLISTVHQIAMDCFFDIITKQKVYIYCSIISFAIWNSSSGEDAL